MNKLREVIRNNMPVILGVLVGIASLNIWVVIAFSIDIVGLKSTYEAIESGFIVLVATAIGAIVGSYSTYWLKKKEEDKTEYQKRVNALHTVIFTLNMQKKAIDLIWITIDRYESEYERGVVMPAYPIPTSSNIKQDLPKLSFLMEYKKRHSLMDLFEMQMLYELALQSVVDRTEFYAEKVQPILHDLNIININDFKELDIQGYLGNLVFNEAISNANKMHNIVDMASKEIKLSLVYIRETAESIFPNEDFDK